MTAPFVKLVNTRHDNMVLIEKQDQAIKLANSRRKETPAKKNSGWVPELVLAALFIIAVAIAVYMSTASHYGAPSFSGTPVSEMSISEQLKMAEEARYND